MAIAAGCSGQARDPAADPELTGDWATASPATVAAPTTQTMCKAVTATPTAPTFSAEQPPLPASFEIIAREVQFRCNQQVCGYVQDFGELVRVLLQPCDLHPTVVPKCSCLFDVTVSIPARAYLGSFDLYQRADFYGATDDNPPRMIGTATGVNRP